MEENKNINKEEPSSSLTKLDSNLNVVDSVLDKIGKIIKKRWWIIISLVVGYMCYWFFGVLDKEIKKEAEDPVIEQNDSEGIETDTIFYDDGTYELQPLK